MHPGMVMCIIVTFPNGDFYTKWLSIDDICVKKAIPRKFGT